MKLKKVVESRIIEAIRELGNMPIPPKASYWASKLSRKVNEELETYEKARLEILKKYAEKDESGELKVSPENTVNFLSDDARKEFAAQVDDLLDYDVKFDSIQLQAFGDKADIPPWIFASFDDLVVE